MAKGSGNIRKSQLSSNVSNFILAYTAKGGEDFAKFSRYYTDKNREAFHNYLEKAPKVKGDVVYRASQMLTGDIEDLIMNPTNRTLDGVTLGNNVDKILSFSYDKERVMGYGGTKPWPKKSYDKFQNEPMTVRFIVKTKGKHFVDISKQSHYKQEQEVVTPTKTRFRLKNMNYRGSWWDIELDEI